MNNDQLKIRTAGFDGPDGNLLYEGPFHAAGRIALRDGIGMRFENDPAGFVISFTDLEKVYLAAKEARDELPVQEPMPWDDDHPENQLTPKGEEK